MYEQRRENISTKGSTGLLEPQVGLWLVTHQLPLVLALQLA